MATPPVSNTLEVAQHYATVAGLNAALVNALRRLPPPGRVPTSTYLTQVAALVHFYSQAAISLSRDHYIDMRALAGVTAAFTVPVVDPPSTEAAQAAIVAALAGADLAPDLDEPAIATAVQNLIEGITQLLVTEAGQDAIWTALEEDPRSVGWARVVRPGACAFCRMLATRGPVYRTERSASFLAHHADEHGGGDCQCGVEPLFKKDYVAPDHVKSDQQTWSETGNLYDFRRAIEGRSDSPSRKRTRQRTRAGR